MARPSKNTVINYTTTHNLTHGLLERAVCPPDRPFVLLKDQDKKGLRLRVTKAGGKHWQFETRMKGKLISRTLGEWPAVSIAEAKEKAHRLRGMTEVGTDPREVERRQLAEREALRQKEKTEEFARSLSAASAWTEYIQARRPQWGERHYQDHVKLTQAGGKITKRGTRGSGVTKPGLLTALLSQPLAKLTATSVEKWALEHANSRPTAARLALRCLKAFLNWCTDHPEYAALLAGTNPAKSRKARESLGKAGVKQDALLREQLPAWFSAIHAISNPTIAAYLQIILLTGARPGEVLGIQWADIDSKWKGLTIRDKVEGERVIPLTPYVYHLISALPRRNEYVFATNRTLAGTNTIVQPRKPHEQACAVAGIGELTLHGLRRSFKSLTEWLDIPAGVVAQVMGHKPSATAEKHYTVRPLDLLRVHHERIEAWILEQANVTMPLIPRL